MRGSVGLLTFATLVLMLSAACSDDDSGSGTATISRLSIAIGAHGCEPLDATARAGKIEFTVSNPRSSPITTFSIDQEGVNKLFVSNVIGGLTRTASVSLAEGTYSMTCEKEGAGGSGTLTVTT